MRFPATILVFYFLVAVCTSLPVDSGHQNTLETVDIGLEGNKPVRSARLARSFGILGLGIGLYSGLGGYGGYGGYPYGYGSYGYGGYGYPIGNGGYGLYGGYPILGGYGGGYRGGYSAAVSSYGSGIFR